MNLTHRTVWTIGTLLLLAGAPNASADSYPAGTTVAKGDADHTPWPATQHDKISLCGIDLDGSTAYGPGEPLYIDIDSTTCDQVEPKDIRLSTFEGLKAGKEVKHEDLDRGLPTLAVPHKIRYTDLLGKSKFESGNGLYIDVLQTGDLMVGNGDLRLVQTDGYVAFTPVRPGATDAGMPYSELVAGGVDVNTDSVIYKAGSAYYVNVDAGKIDDKDRGVEDPDVRLNDKAAKATGGADAVGRPRLTITGLSVVPETPSAGAPLRATITVSNEEDSGGSGIVETTIDGIIVDSRGSPTLAPGDNATLVVTLIAPSGGPFTLGAGEMTLRIPLGTATASAQEVASGPAASAVEANTITVGGDADTTQEAAAPLVMVLLATIGVIVMSMRRRS